MDAEQQAEKNVKYAPMYWRLNYFLVVVVFLQRIEHVFTRSGSDPMDGMKILSGAVALAYCVLPVMVGRAFKRCLKAELENGSLTVRIFEICDWRIAQLLFLSYLGMLLYGLRF